MSLNSINLKPFGHFNGADAAFTVTRQHLPRPWHYIYATPEILLKVSHQGICYAQVNPPGGILLFKQERFEISPALLLWFKDGANSAFSNFAMPGIYPCGGNYDEFSCDFHPEYAEYRVARNQWQIISRTTIAMTGMAIILKITVRNTAECARSLEMIPLWRPHNTHASMAPWDVPELYQTCQYFNDNKSGFMVETRDPGARQSNRKYSVLLTDMPVTAADTDYRRFTGDGGMMRPDGLNGVYNWPLDNRRSFPLNQIGTPDSTTGFMPLAALTSGHLEFSPGQELEFTIVLEHIAGFDLDAVKLAVESASTKLSHEYWNSNFKAFRSTYENWTEKFRIETPESELNEYVNSWLPWQLNWVGMLDRGWPTGMRGTRDSAQDYSGIGLFDSTAARRVLLEILACQRLDGSFPRQFSTSGPDGVHDLRDYVDSGCWVFELLYDYLRYTNDFQIMEEPCRWLDLKENSPVKEHAKRLLEYYLADWNLGEHGLVMLRHGDWNDSFNSAGIKGIGESVMVSCQVVFLLKLAAKLFPDETERYAAKAETMRSAIRRHALNSAGYLNGVYTDDHHWLFSPEDIDGEYRINGAVNSWGIIAGIFETKELPVVLEKLKSLKGPCGYRLFHPPLGVKPIANAGRLGSGDAKPGLAENGTVYNHGSQGFLLRALCVLKQGDFALDVLHHLLPYDQRLHLVEVVKAEPYGILNHWTELNGIAGEGGSPFLSGTISTAIRAIYDGLFGIKIELDGIRIEPSLPSCWKQAKCQVTVRGHRIEISIYATGRNHIKLNGRDFSDNFIHYTKLNEIDGPIKIEVEQNVTMES